MKLTVQVLENGTQIRVRRPRRGFGETGIWVIVGRVIGSGLDDPIYEIQGVKHGRVRMMRKSRLKILRKGKTT